MAKQLPSVFIDASSEGLAYQIVPVRFRTDMLHIAVATVADTDMVVS